MADRRSGVERARERIRAGEGETFGDEDPVDADLLASDREAIAAVRRRAKAQDAEARKAWEADESERRAARAGRKATRAKAARKVRKVRRVGRQAARTGPTGSFTGFVVWTLALVLLYIVLRRADRVGGFLGGIQRGIEWLADPYTIVEFGGSNT